MFHYFYKITNNLDGKFYFGVHNTENLGDGYSGSGKVLKSAYQKYGIENFTKEIIKFFDTEEEAFSYEREIVNEEMIKNPDCYNVQIGGKYFNTIGRVTVRDKDGNRFWVEKTEDIYISGEVKPIWTGKHHKEESKQKTRERMTPKNSTNKRIWVNREGKVKYLLKEHLDEYLSNGWKLGRTGYKPRKHCQGKEIDG